MKVILGWILLSLVFSGVALAQATINTYAGADDIFAGSGQPAIAAHLLGTNNTAVDSQGNVYISNSGLCMVLKVSTNGVISIAAGNGLAGFAGDGGLATGASLSYPNGLAVDSSGNLFIVDAYNSNVRKVSTTGIITTVAGGGGAGGFGGDGGLATKAILNLPTAVAVDKSGNLYILDTGNDRVRMVNASTGVISTIAGSGNSGYSGDGGPAINASFSNPGGLTIDSSGNLYIADTNNAVIREISGGTINLVAGVPNKGGYTGDGVQATKTNLSFPRGVAVDASGNLYIADTGNERIRRVSGGIINTIAGTSQAGFGGDGSAATSAMFSTPAAVAVDASGNVYVEDLDNNRIRRFVPGGAINTYAGTATSIGDGGPSTQARLNRPSGAAVDSSGNLYIADTGENRVRKVTLSGTITTVAGTGQTGLGGDGGLATAAVLNSPSGVAVDSTGNLYIADAGNNVIRKVDQSTGKISAFAGNYSCCYTGKGSGGDGGLATNATLFYPTSVAVDGAGNVYFTDLVQSNTPPDAIAIRRVTTDGKINTWAGGVVPGVGFSGDGMSPLQAQFSSGVSLAAASDGTLYIADTNNSRVRKIDPAGATITTVAGNGQTNPSGNGGPATSAGVQLPFSVTVDGAGNLYIGSLTTVRKVTGTTISAYAGSGANGFSGDGGPATAATLAFVPGMATDSGNNLYIVDNGNNRVRQVQPAVPPAIGLSSNYVTFSLTVTGSTPSTQQLVVANSGQGTLNWTAAATTTSGGPWLSVAPSSGSTLSGTVGDIVTVTANPSSLAPGDYYGQIQVTSPNAASPVQMITVRFTIQTAGEDPPAVAAGGVLSDASYALKTPVAPGAFVAIFGSNFTDSTSPLIAATLPFPNQLGGTSVTIGGEPVPLYAVTAGQIDAILPFDLPVNTSLPIVVTRNNAVSAPQPVSMVSSEPGIFTQSQNGLGVGSIEIFRPDGSYEGVAGNGNSATAGDVIVIYCTGLGDVSPRAVAGFPAPSSPLAQTIDPVTMSIGGVNAPVVFAGPSPGYVGLYQVNATVPSGITPNQQAPLVLTQGGRPSLTVTIPMQ